MFLFFQQSHHGMGGDLSSVGDTVQIGVYCCGSLAVTKELLDRFNVYAVCQQ